ncbi:helix-turn-helix domain containing protein [Clostridioides sp. ZZV15-6383]|uniref:helix-turn-helix domain containing protein n=1 Tax=unclassified Clostridioides TaxID=2635829 RepID=UPI001D112DB3|nr:helix-turn-helix domain containing protein [Clostridioides sp. ZZV15-6383]MCC0726451.1 helix-turn-helix domain containing protein [Clostridioides sp. ZZV14-6045]MCC0731311.1 helix-turn-helix domain containing protein [Clostridioides sp. ZZV14-6048]MCC0735257.1 helix-turn-helix domain containing protein [Clostridioides sp. ZZV14-6009]MCC0739885.1 helix-turn-helix domain containing protein [Clostridioides sp. ZZV14-5902]
MSIKYKDKEFVLVEKKNVNELDNSNIKYIDLKDKQYYVVTQGRRSKRFNNEDVSEIKKDLDIGMSLRKCAEKWNCSTRTIQDIKQNKY